MQVRVLDEINVCFTRIGVPATITGYGIVTKEWEKDGPGCEDDDISV